MSEIAKKAKTIKKSTKKPKETNEDTKAITPTDHSPPSTDFEAGMLFSKFDKSGQGIISADDFRKIWREAKENSHTLSNKAVSTGVNATKPLTELEQLFVKFDRDKDGKLDKDEFDEIMKVFPEMLKVGGGFNQTAPITPSQQSALPTEIITGRLLTHYDETAGIAIPSSVVEHHRSMGSTVTPLVEAYRSRYERLRLMLTGRLLPRREHLLQLRRQLDDCSVDVAATRRAIEKETTTDCEQILERLRNAENLRQSAIRQQMLHLEGELENIERVVRKVELANERSHSMDGSKGVVVLTSASPTNADMYGTDAGVEHVKAPRAASMVELIQQFADISATIERLATRALTVQIDFPATDFPRETADRLDKISRFDKCVHAMEVKDQLLWTALTQKDEAQNLLGHEKTLCQQYASELADWANITQEFARKLEGAKRENESLRRRNEELSRVLRDHNILYVVDDDSIDMGNKAGDANDERDYDSEEE